MIRFETYDRLTLRGRRYFFRMVSEGNNEVMSQGQPYRNRASRDIAIGKIKAGAAAAVIRKGTRT